MTDTLASPEEPQRHFSGLAQLLDEGVDPDLLEYYERRAHGLEPPPDNRRWPQSQERRQLACVGRRLQINHEIDFHPIDFDPMTSQQQKDCLIIFRGSRPCGRRPFETGGDEEWTVGDENYLLDLVQEFEIDDWPQIASYLEREERTCQEKYRQLSGLHLDSQDDNNSPWTAQENASLVRWVEDYGIKCWIRISHFFQRPLDVCQRQYEHIVIARSKSRPEPFSGLLTPVTDDGNFSDSGLQRGTKRHREDHSEPDSDPDSRVSSINTNGPIQNEEREATALPTPKRRCKLRLNSPKEDLDNDSRVSPTPKKRCKLRLNGPKEV